MSQSLLKEYSDLLIPTSQSTIEKLSIFSNEDPQTAIGTTSSDFSNEDLFVNVKKMSSVWGAQYCQWLRKKQEHEALSGRQLLTSTEYLLDFQIEQMYKIWQSKDSHKAKRSRTECLKHEIRKSISRGYVCNFCTRSFVRERNLSNHIKTKHLQQNE